MTDPFKTGRVPGDDGLHPDAIDRPLGNRIEIECGTVTCPSILYFAAVRHGCGGIWPSGRVDEVRNGRVLNGAEVSGRRGALIDFVE